MIAGKTSETARSRAAAGLPLVAVARSHEPLPEVALEFLNGPSQAMTWPVRRVMSLIGSASGCKFRLTDASVSRFHASLVRTSVGLWIVDLLGQGGITSMRSPFVSAISLTATDSRSVDIRFASHTGAMPRQIADEWTVHSGPNPIDQSGRARDATRMAERPQTVFQVRPRLRPDCRLRNRQNIR